MQELFDEGYEQEVEEAPVTKKRKTDVIDDIGDFLMG